MKLIAFLDVEGKESLEKLLQETDLKPFLELGSKLFEIKAKGFEINVLGGRFIYSPGEGKGV